MIRPDFDFLNKILFSDTLCAAMHWREARVAIKSSDGRRARARTPNIGYRRHVSTCAGKKEAVHIGSCHYEGGYIKYMTMVPAICDTCQKTS